MKRAELNRKTILFVGVGLLFAPACGKSGMGKSVDAARDLPSSPDEPPTADTAPLGRDDLAPDLRPSDPTPQPDLFPVRDAPDDPSDGASRDTGQPDRAEPPDLVSEVIERDDAPPSRDLPPVDVGSPDELPKKADGGSTTDGGGNESNNCTSTGGTVESRQCCTGATPFFDTCTTAVGACGCSPTSSVTIQMCSCPTPSCFLPGYGCVGPGSTCTVGADQTCNDNPLISSLHGRCITGGRCVCGAAGMSPTSGKCL